MLPISLRPSPCNPLGSYCLLHSPPGSVCLQGRCIKGGLSYQPLRPPVSAFGLLREIQDPGHIVAVSGFS